MLLILLGIWIPGRRLQICSITDGSRVLVYTTQQSEPEQMLREAGLTLGPDDSYEAILENGIWQIRLLRGKHQNRVIRREEQYTRVLQPEQIRCADPALPEGFQVVLREGRCGEVECRDRVIYTNEVETGREVLEQRVRVQPVSRVVAVGAGSIGGTGDQMPVIRDGLIFLPTGEVLTYDRVITSLATAYCDKGLTATGTQARVGAIAVDPEVIPYGTRMFIVSNDGEYVYGLATAEDCGSKEHIYGTRTDLHFDTYAQCIAFGARFCQVYFLS